MAMGQTVGRKKGKLPVERADKAADDLPERQAALHEAFRVNLIARRQELSLTKIELAYRSGLTRAYVQKVESGMMAPSLYAAVAMARVLKTSVDKLCRDPE